MGKNDDSLIAYEVKGLGQYASVQENENVLAKKQKTAIDDIWGLLDIFSGKNPVLISEKYVSSRKQ